MGARLVTETLHIDTNLSSPNHDSRKGRAIDMLVLHYTEVGANEALKILTDNQRENRVSAHYLIDQTGGIKQLVPDDKRAWHAGQSHWRGESDNNARSIGIEIENTGNAPYPPAQIKAVITLCRQLITRYRIPAQNIVGHSDIAPGRKIDPGIHFPWQELAHHGIGLWPEHIPANPRETSRLPRKTALSYLRQIGYCITDEDEAKSVIRAFNMRYLQRQSEARLTRDSRDALSALHRALFPPSPPPKCNDAQKPTL